MWQVGPLAASPALGTTAVRGSNVVQAKFPSVYMYMQLIMEQNLMRASV